jgi:capsular polysaccharide biosynthesis protein
VLKQFSGNLTLEQTVRLFSSCVLFVAPHGAGLTNMLFMREGEDTVVIVRL